jgi:glycosyltransferase involved in cell wall biosynthesis
VILEAMASGLPVAAVSAGGIADHLRHLQNGIACSPDESSFSAAIRHLADDRDCRLRMGAAARTWAVAIGWERELDRLVESYREVLVQTGLHRRVPRRGAAA